jgi:hypothetical protein
VTVKQSLILITLTSLLLLAACAPEAAVLLSTASPTNTSYPTHTPYPTITPSPTPTNTSTPTNTPPPTNTPIPSATMGPTCMIAPFRPGTAVNGHVYVDLDPDPGFRDWMDDTSCYGCRPVCDGHKGTDFYIPDNTEVVLPYPGVVIEAEDGWPANPKAGDPDTGLAEDGNRVRVYSQMGSLKFIQIFAHLSSVSVEVGQALPAGYRIGTSGRTGVFPDCEPYGHLHYQVNRTPGPHEWGTPIDPYSQGLWCVNP